MPAKNWPPPGYQLVQGDHALTATWSIYLPEQFTRRIEDGSLVLWRPGLTLWLTVWGNNNNESQAERLRWIRDEASPARFDARESIGGDVTRLSYRLRDENDEGPVDSLCAFIIADDGHLQASIYFDDVKDAVMAQQIVDSLAARAQHS
jgi:hypothetical protein